MDINQYVNEHMKKMKEEVDLYIKARLKEFQITASELGDHATSGAIIKLLNGIEQGKTGEAFEEFKLMGYELEVESQQTQYGVADEVLTAKQPFPKITLKKVLYTV